MTRRLTHAAALALAPASLRALNPPPRAPVAPPAPAKRPGPLDATAAGVVVVELPGLRLVNPLNQRSHWRVVSERGRREKAATAAALRGRTPPPFPVVVEIVRVSPGRLDDDGATAAGKHVRDSVALWMGCDDADPRVRFVVTQAKGAAAVRIVVAPARPDVVRGRCVGCGCVGDVEVMR